MVDTCSSFSDRMLTENIGMILEYAEKHTPEKDPFWHDLESAPLYGVEETLPVFLTEYTGKKVMDMMTEVRYWWEERYPELIREMNFFRKILADSLTADCRGIHVSAKPYSRKKLTPEERKICDRNLSAASFIGVDEAERALEKLEQEKRREEQKYLHLCIELREYLQ